MSGTKAGGQKTSETIKSKYGADYYIKMGSLGGKVKSPLKGFGSNRKRASEAGRLGGKISKRRA